MKKFSIVAFILSFMLIANIFSVVATSTTSGTTATQVKSEVLTNKDGIASEVVGNIRVQVYSPTLVRVEEKGPKGFEDRSTFHILNRTDWDGDVVSKTETDDLVVLETSSVKIEINKTASKLSDVKILSKQNKLLWEYTELPHNKVYLPDLSEKVDSWEIADTPRIVPAEWGLTPQPESNTENRATNGWDLSNDAPDMYIFLPDSDHKQLRHDYVRLTGQTEMLPLSALGAWDSRYYAYSQASAMEQLDGYHNRNLPLDNLVIDTDWRKSEGGIGYDVNTDLFPDMEQFIKDSHAKNVNIIFNDHPEPTKTGDVQNNVLVENEVNYRFSNLTKILDLGVDAWWYDRNWSTTIKPLEGFTHEVMGMAVYADAAKTFSPNKRLFMMSNIDGVSNGYNSHPANIAAHRYSIQWTGDTIGGQESILQEIATTVNLGAYSALPYVSADLGTHNTKSVNLLDDEYIRWMQMGALSPIFRPHVSANDVGRMPWLKGEEVTDTFRDYINLRYRLLPTFYQLSNENYETGMPLTRSMAFDYPEYSGANAGTQYMLGEDILVAPAIDNTPKGALPTEWLKTPDDEIGIKAEYFNNANLSGTPALTRTESQVDFNWGTNSPGSGVNSDYFSARYTGTVTVGDRDVQLEAFADDGFRLYIDGELNLDKWQPQEATKYLSNKVLKAGETYEIKYEYFDNTHDAVCRLGYVSTTDRTSERSVWIPEGEWINTINGETVYGPQTISVQSKTEEMPIFIKKGTILPLADEMLTTKEKDWSHLTLDIYPSTRQSDSTILYEDDTESNDYQKGLYRTTELSTYSDKDSKRTTVKIGAAQGDFNGDRAFTNRDWTLRVHQPENWGELESAKLSDGTVLNFKKNEKDLTAMPLMISGGSTDGAVYEIEMSSDVYKGKTVLLQFATMADPAIPNINFDKPIKQTEADITSTPIDHQIKITDVPETVNLTTDGTNDWLFPGYIGTMTRKADADKKIKMQYPKTSSLMFDYKTKFSFEDGTDRLSLKDTQLGIYTTNLNDYFEWSVTSGPIAQELTLYIGGWNASGRLTVFGDSGETVFSTYDLPNTSGSYYKKVVIKLQSEKPANLYIRYILASTGFGNVTFAAATLRDLPDVIMPEINKDISVTDEMPESVNLSTEGNADWIYAGDSIESKSDVTSQMLLTAPENHAVLNSFATKFNWNDGKTKKSGADKTDALSHSNQGGIFEMTVQSDSSEKELVLYVGGQNSKSTLEIFDETQNRNLETFELSNNSGAYYKKVVIKFSSDYDTGLHIRYTLTEKYDDNANSIFAAATLNTENQLIIDSGAYSSGAWTAGNVNLNLSAKIPSDAVKYQVSVNGADWQDLSSPNYKVTLDGTYNLEFRFTDKAGSVSKVSTFTVKKDSTKPDLIISVTSSDDDKVFTPKILSENPSEITVYYKVDGGNWRKLGGDSIDTKTFNGLVYRFKAVNEAGLESSVLFTTPDQESEIIGDINGDGKVTVTDVVTLRSIIMGDSTPDAAEFARADLNNDGKLTVTDIVAVRAIIMN